MNALTDKETGDLVEASIHLSKIEYFLIESGKLPDKEGYSAGNMKKEELFLLEQKMNVSHYLEMAKPFLYIPKMRKLYDSLSRIYKNKE